MSVEYVIYYPAAKSYLRLNSKAKAEWVDELAQAHRFSNRNKVDNFMHGNFRCAVSNGVDSKSVEVLSWDDAVRRGLKSGMTEDEAARYLDALPDMISQMYKTGNVVRSLIAYYAGQISVADKAQEDLLHKIEFSHANVVDGYRMYRDLQDVRLRRRQCKDICDMLGTIHTSGTMNGLASMKVSMERCRAHLETRIYRPRILAQMFTESELKTEREVIINETA